MKKTISHKDITPNQYIYLKGKLTYSRITSQIMGKELEALNRKRSARGAMPYNFPFTTATVKDPKIISSGNKQTINEKYVEENFYKSASGNTMFTAINKWELPFIGHYVEDTHEVDIIENPLGELAKDLDVTLILRTYSGQMGNNGVVLDAIIVNGEIKYENRTTGRDNCILKVKNYASLIECQK